MFLGKWLYELGKRHAYEQLRAELYLYIGREPVRYSDLEFDMKESEASYKKRIDAWFEARKLLDAFFQEKSPRRDDDLI